MTTDELTARYLLARLLWWRYDLEQLDADTVQQLVSILEETKKELRKRLAVELGTSGDLIVRFVNCSDAIADCLDDVLTQASAAVAGTITSASVISAVASIATYNATLTFDGLATTVEPIGMTREQVRAWAAASAAGESMQSMATGLIAALSTEGSRGGIGIALGRQAGLSVDQIRQWFQETPLGGGLLDDWVNRAFDDGAKNSMLAALRQVGLEGKGTAAAIKKLLDTALNEGFELTQRQATILARTYIQTANVQAALASYERNSNVIKGVRWATAHTNRVCHLCAPLDGQVYLWGERRPPWPRHPGCMCTPVPVAKTWRDFGIDRDELEAVAKPWTLRDGPVGAGGQRIRDAGTTRDNFPGWWKTLSHADQVQSIGAVRTQLILEGRLSWEQLVNKNSGHYYTLNELGFSQTGERL